MNFDAPRLHRKRDSAEYQRVHKWVYRNLGKADHCSIDPSHVSGRYHWSNVSRQYKMESADWQMLCPTCHRAFDGISDDLRELKRSQAIGNSSRAKTVFKLYPSGSWIKYPSAYVAAKSNGLKATALNNCLTGLNKTSGGFRWKYGG